MGEQWGAEQFRGADLGRKGRAETCAEVVEALASGAGKSFSAACGGRLRQSGGDLLQRPDQTPARLLAGPRAALGERCRGLDLVLVATDLTSFNLSGRKTLSDLGGIGDQVGAQALLCHGALAVGEDGEPLGIVDVYPWSRAEPLPEGEERPYEAEESRKWERALRVVEGVLGDCGATVVVVTDAESDGFEYLSAARREGVALLARASQDRVVRSGVARGLLWAVTLAWKVAGTMEVDVPRRAGKGPATAELEARYGEVEVQPPSRLSGWPPVRLG
ncbi:MAG: hypothetical protein HYU66_20850, partial [Armatimonadetes bacterium]|nr:hypothetical protein [Armatimonadota bacterium]